MSDKPREKIIKHHFESEICYQVASWLYTETSDESSAMAELLAEEPGVHFLDGYGLKDSLVGMKRYMLPELKRMNVVIPPDITIAQPETLIFHQRHYSPFRCNTTDLARLLELVGEN